MKKTLVLGASTNPTRYSYLAVHRLLAAGYEAIPLGIKKGEIAGITIINEKKMIEGIDTVAIYLNPKLQREYYDYIIQLNPKRIIFNPGTENYEFAKIAQDHHIETVNGCTLVMLAIDQY